MLVTDHHQSFLVPKSDIDRRISAMQDLLTRQNIGAAWIQYPADRLYFTGTIQDGVLLIPAKGDASFYIKKSLTRAKAEASVNIKPFPGRKVLIKALRSMLDPGQRIGLALDVTPASVYAMLLTNLPEIEIADITLPLRSIKAIKSAWEIEQIEHAAEQAEALFDIVPDLIREGMTELELSAEAERYLRIKGHAGAIRTRMSPDPMSIITVASGGAALHPTGFNGSLGSYGMYPVTAHGASRKKIRKGETVALDVVTAYNGYHADHTRIFYIGQKVPTNVQLAHQFCCNVLSRLESEIRPGKNCMDIYNSVMNWAKTSEMPDGFNGAGENRIRFFAHGIGTELDEFPVIADRFDMELQAGMVLAIEPKAFLPETGCVGVENTYIITEDGCKNLCATTAELVCIN